MEIVYGEQYYPVKYVCMQSCNLRGNLAQIQVWYFTVLNLFMLPFTQLQYKTIQIDIKKYNEINTILVIFLNKSLLVPGVQHSLSDKHKPRRIKIWPQQSVFTIIRVCGVHLIKRVTQT